MQVGMRKQFDRRRHHRDAVVRQVLAEIERAGRQLEAIQVAKATLVRHALREIEQANPVGLPQMAKDLPAGGVAGPDHGGVLTDEQCYAETGRASVRERVLKELLISV